MILARASSGIRNDGGVTPAPPGFSAGGRSSPVRSIAPVVQVEPGGDAMVFGSGVLVGVGLCLVALVAVAMF
jgi:hypothetical protein